MVFYHVSAMFKENLNKYNGWINMHCRFLRIYAYEWRCGFTLCSFDSSISPIGKLHTSHSGLTPPTQFQCEKIQSEILSYFYVLLLQYNMFMNMKHMRTSTNLSHPKQTITIDIFLAHDILLVVQTSCGWHLHRSMWCNWFLLFSRRTPSRMM